MKKFSAAAAVLAITSSLLIGSTAVSNASAVQPTVKYTFEGNTNDSGNGSTFTAAPACPGDPCNATTAFGTEDGDGYLEWTSTDPRGGGFVIDTKQSLTNTYTILMKFSFADFSGYRKIIDYLDRGSDTGFYILNSRINFYPLGTSTNSFTPGQAMTLMVTRQATTGNEGVFTVYSYNGTTFNQELQVTDTQGTSIPAASTVHAGGTKLGFFFDDTATRSEATSSGKVFNIKMWSGAALTAADLETVATTPASVDNTPVEEPVTEEPTTEEPTDESLAETGANDFMPTLLSGLLLVVTGAFVLRRRAR